MSPRLVRGSELSHKVRREILARFVYRVTRENPQGAKLTGATIAPVSDDQWLADHAFYVVKDGSRLARNKRHCEPWYLANE